MSSYLNQHIDVYYRQLMKKETKLIIGEHVIYESNEEHFNRLRRNLHELLKVENRDTLFARFVCSVKNALEIKPSIPSQYVILYAVEEFKNGNIPDKDDVIKWCDRPIVELEKEFACYEAYNMALIELHKTIEPWFYNQSQKDKKEISLDLKLKWKSESTILVLFFNKLIDSKFRLIECEDFKVFENHFTGKKESQKIVWCENLGLLIYLLDNMHDFLEKELYKYDKKTEEYSIKPFIVNHFKLKTKAGLKDFTKDSIYAQRSSFNKYLKKGTLNNKKIEKIDIVIQELKEKTYD